MGASGRRRWLAIVAGSAALLAGTLGATQASAQDGDGGHEGHDPVGLLPPGDWTDEQVMQAGGLVADATEALPAFADEGQLEALGFYDFGVRAPGGWDHWINPEWMADDAYLDPTRPESLVFRATPEGDYVLEAAMYVLPDGYDMDSIPAEVAWLPGWHVHDDICVDDQDRFAGLADPDGTCFSGTPLDWPPMMHVWITDNPCGHRFAGVDVGGIECGGHGHDPDPPGHGHEDPTPTDPGHSGHDGHDDHGDGGHGGHNTTSTSTTTSPGSGHGGHDQHRPAPPATPVPAHPHFQG
jgi:hypothetical protein